MWQNQKASEAQKNRLKTDYSEYKFKKITEVSKRQASDLIDLAIKRKECQKKIGEIQSILAMEDSEEKISQFNQIKEQFIRETERENAKEVSKDIFAKLLSQRTIPDKTKAKACLFSFAISRNVIGCSSDSVITERQKRFLVNLLSAADKKGIFLEKEIKLAELNCLEASTLITMLSNIIDSIPSLPIGSAVLIENASIKNLFLKVQNIQMWDTTNSTEFIYDLPVYVA